MQAPPTTSSAPSLGGLTDSLNRIQGNILAGFNLPSQAFLHLSFGNSSENARQWLAELVRENVIASTRQVLDRSEKAWVAVSFTSSGLLVLNPGLAGDLMKYRAFWDGAIADRVDEKGVRTVSPALVGDQEAGDPRTWAIGGPNEAPIDVLMTIAASYDDLLEERAERERTRAKKYDLTVLMVRSPTGDPTPGQYGYRLRGGVEHFGFKDGISQPSIRDFPPQAVKDQADTSIAAGEFVLGYQTEESPVVQDSPVPPDWMCNGSFQVWLRLNQNVALWRRQMKVLRKSSKDGVDVAAKVIGRQQDGTPLAYGGTSENVRDLNDFNYFDDPSGLKTPLFAHMRKMYPRDPESGDRCRRLLRRGIPFGPPLNPRDSNDATERGLVFNAFMADIVRQFEFIQRTWASSPASISPADINGGPDPVVGTSDAGCPFQRQSSATVVLGFERFVWTTGAVYAFAPSIPTLAWLAGQGPRPVGV